LCAAQYNGFDGLHTYNICAQVKGKTPDELREWSKGYYERAVKIARDHGRISCLDVIPGYDDTKVRHPGLAVNRLDGQVYRILWEQAIKANPDWVLITSWNEWHEGSEIEPSYEFGNKYLRLTARYSRRFLANP
ncbi:MAG: glycoside hydrolase family 99-like domain-containing protein, partial [Limisphaerales bacterium]